MAAYLSGVVLHTNIPLAKDKVCLFSVAVITHWPKPDCGEKSWLIFCLEITVHHCGKSERGSRQEQSRKQMLCVNAFSWLASQAFLSYYPSYTARAHPSRDPRAHRELGPPMPVRRLPHRYGGISLIVSPFSIADNQN